MMMGEDTLYIKRWASSTTIYELYYKSDVKNGKNNAMYGSKFHDRQSNCSVVLFAFHSHVSVNKPRKEAKTPSPDADALK